MSKQKKAKIVSPDGDHTIRVGTTFALEGEVLEVVRIGNRRKKVWVRPSIGFIPEPRKMTAEQVFEAMDADDSPFQVGVRECGLNDERLAAVKQVVATPLATAVVGIDWAGELYPEGFDVEVTLGNPEDYSGVSDVGMPQGRLTNVNADNNTAIVGDRRVYLKDITDMRLLSA